jgi:hypothetical protein
MSELRIWGDTLLQKLKDAKIKAESEVIINGESFDKLELKAALKDKSCHYTQSKRYYGFIKIPDETIATEVENIEALQSETWQVTHKYGVMIGNVFYDNWKAHNVIKGALKRMSKWATTTTIDGEEFTAKELRYALAHDCCNYRQTKYDYSFTYSYLSHEAIESDVKAMHSQTWNNVHKQGVVIGSEFLYAEDANKLIRKSLKDSNADAVSILDVTVPYKPFKDLLTIWHDYCITITNGTPTQIIFAVSNQPDLNRYFNKSTILATTKAELVIKLS